MNLVETGLDHCGAALNLLVADLNSSSCARMSSSSVMPLCSILVCFFSRFCCTLVHGRIKSLMEGTYLLLLLVVLRNIEYRRDVVAKVEFLQCCLDMLAGYCLLRVLFGNFVGFRGYEGDELDAAFYKEISRVFCKSHTRLAGEDVLDYLLYGRWNAV